VAEQQSPVEKQIGELEIAVDRLRSLYEQYFMGIEKIEPMVPRKDVDRRIYTVRKEQIRNTALRFRFQMILQRYNTYQTHWQRICREIENGTFKRHLLRAKQRFGSSKPPPRPQVAAPPGPREQPAPGAEIAADLAAELAELDREFASAEFQIDVEVELPDSSPDARQAPAIGRPGLPPRPDASQVPVPARKVPSDPPPGLTSLAPPLPPPRPVGASRAPTPLPPPRPRAVSVTGEVRGTPLPPPRPRAVSVTGEVRGTPLPPPRPRAPSATNEGGGPALPPPRPRVPSATNEGRPPPPRPPTAAPPPARASHTPLHPPPAASPPPPRGQELPEARMKQLYAQLVEAKRRQNESTAAVTYQTVAKTLQESGEKLREKHGRAVDFEVTIKDGKAILKPVLK
jgi:hypothetical protein